MSTLEHNIRRVLEILLPKIQARHQDSPELIVLGIAGLQGSGKSTWASKIRQLLTDEHHLRTVIISLDDLYKTHDGLIAQRDANPENKLYRTRGQPGTHDEQLAVQFFRKLREYKGEGETPLGIPSFDKSKFNGEGDRAPESLWPTITSKPDIIIFEGWCVGFRPLLLSEVEQKLQLVRDGKSFGSTSALAKHKLDHLLEVNENLKNYCDTFMGPQHFDFMIHIDTDDLSNVYEWRLQQEHKLIEATGMGMKDEEVSAFIDGYIPGYELYLDKFREGFFDGQRGRQVRVVLDKERKIERIDEL